MNKTHGVREGRAKSGAPLNFTLTVNGDVMIQAAERKKFRERANRARRGLLNEKKEYGYINDGSGKRYRAGVFYLLSGDVKKALEFYSWF